MPVILNENPKIHTLSLDIVIKLISEGFREIVKLSLFQKMDWNEIIVLSNYKTWLNFDEKYFKREIHELDII